MVGVMNAAQPKIEDDDDDMEVCIDGVRVGSRVKSNGELGTVRYVGEIIGYGGDWIGVDWDNEERGKHNGCVERIQYFMTHKPKSGSFVRRAKLDLMQSCEEAIKQYYGMKEDSQTEAKRLAAINNWKKEIRAPFLEMVGFDKIQIRIGKFQNLVEACIHDRNVSSAGDLANLCPHLRVLDASKNLISDWNTVADIVRQLTHLRDLDLSKNRLSLPTRRECTNMRVYFDKLLKLNLSYCEYRWHEILKLAKIWPFVEELILAGNDLSTLEQPSPDVFMNLSVLRLDGNPIRSWSEISKLGSLGTLKVLSLNECQLESVTLEEDDGDNKTDEFRNLEVLFLNRNQIDNWRSVSELDKLQKLKRLYFTKNPILEEVDYDTGCQYVVARIGNLQEFNGAKLSLESRRGAEYDYLKKHGLQYKLAQEDESLKAAFIMEHHRFQNLIEKHGLPEDSLLADKQKPSLLSSKLLEITLKDEKSGEIIKNKFPPSTMVQRLTALAHRSFKPKNKPRCGFPSLYCLDPSRNNTEIHLDNLLKDLNFYSVANGDVVLWRSVSELDKLQKLKRLYFTKNPILEEVDYDTGCQYVVARIGNLQEFNGAKLSLESRRGAEYDYLKKHGLQYKLAQEDESLKAAFIMEHHRFQHLIEKHGLPEDSLLADKQKPSLLSSKLLEITLKDEKSGEIIKNKFPPSTMVQRLTALAHRSFKPKNKPRCGFPSLYCLDPSRNNTEIHLDNLLKDLNFYSVANGDVVLVRWP